MGRIAGMRGRHPLATGILAGTAVGACMGILLAPRRGSETRKRVGDGVNSGYRRAKDSVGQWARSGRGAYKSTRDKVVKGAKGTSQYVREVANAVTRKAHREGEADLRRMSSASSSGTVGQQPRKAI
jgi:Gas vesicle protein